ncbi:MAG TPA: sigma-70 family RNA polymerase sigma factor [Polyangiaceae bacterium]
MSDEKKGPPDPPSAPPAPQTGPRLPDDHAPDSETHAVAKGVPPPGDEDVVGKPMTRADLDKYVRRGSTKRLMMRVIRWYVRRNAPSDAADDCHAFALLKMAEALERGSGPRSVEKADAWTVKLTVNASIDYFRANKQHAKWLNRDVEVEEQEGEPPEDLHGDDAWLIKPWLEKEVADDQNDRWLFELLCDKARSDKSYAQVCKERGITLPALWNRIHRFKMKYVPRWHRHKERQRAIILLLLLFGAAVAVVVLVLWLVFPGTFERKPEPSIVPAPVPVLVPPPAPEPTQFNQAAPTDGGPTKPPTSDKPPLP